MVTSAESQRGFPVVEAIAIAMLLWALVPVSLYSLCLGHIRSQTSRKSQRSNFRSNGRAVSAVPSLTVVLARRSPRRWAPL